MSNTLDLRTARMIAGPGLALVLAAPALAVNIGLCLWPPYRCVPPLITGAHLLLCGLMLTSTEIALVAEPEGGLMLSWCSALVVMAYLTAGLRLLDLLLRRVPAVACALNSVQQRAKALVSLRW